MDVLLIGNRGGTNIASCFERALLELHLNSILIESRYSMDSLFFTRRINWHLLGRRPPKLHGFSHGVLSICADLHPKLLLTTGIAPLQANTLQKIQAMGIYTINYLTDDPWNRAHYAPWFLSGLPYYHVIATPRRAVIQDLHIKGCENVVYLPFAYDPSLHYAECDQASDQELVDDIVFVGGGDRDRIPYIAALTQAGFRVGLYGSLWERYARTKNLTRGQVDVPTLRRITRNAKVALCLVRRANRDGHVMRSFEIAAIGACMLVEDTAEHREIFGSDNENVVYFQTIGEMVDKLRWLLAHPDERKRLATKAHQHITRGSNTYRDRLQTLIDYIKKPNT